MLKKLKNCTFTQTHLDMNGGVGIFLGLMIGKLCPGTLSLSWYMYATIAIIFSIPLWIVIKKQFSDNLSLKQKSLSNYDIRLWK